MKLYRLVKLCSDFNQKIRIMSIEEEILTLPVKTLIEKNQTNYELMDTEVLDWRIRDSVMEAITSAGKVKS